MCEICKKNLIWDLSWSTEETLYPHAKGMTPTLYTCIITLDSSLFLCHLDNNTNTNHNNYELNGSWYTCVLWYDVSDSLAYHSITKIFSRITLFICSSMILPLALHVPNTLQISGISTQINRISVITVVWDWLHNPLVA